MSDTNEPLLSPDELSAIQDMVSSGEFDTKPYNTDVVAENYSIARNEENLGVSYGSLTQINERFHRFFRTRLLTELDYNARLSVATPQLMKYSEYIRTAESPASINVTELDPLKGETLIVIHPQVVFSCLDNWYGGQARPLTVDGERNFTANENAIIDRLCELMFRSMKEAWSPYVEIDINLVNRDINPLFANIAGDEESVVVNRFSIRLRDEEVQPYIDIVYTYQSLNLQRDMLSSRIQTQEADQKWLERLHASLCEIDFGMFVSGGMLQLSVDQLMNLKVGEVLSFNPPALAEVRVNDFPLYNAEVGESGKKVAIQILDNVLEEDK
ncbi:MAG: FliM/FliN family flagellar motor switch protein [Pseudomonadota bacterium]|nr:FliM/FliN family flagellar motor switch protein [Pseudomonadota bacterium]